MNASESEKVRQLRKICEKKFQLKQPKKGVNDTKLFITVTVFVIITLVCLAFYAHYHPKIK